MSSNLKPKSRLGRGLSSLMSMADLPVEAEVKTGLAEQPPGTFATAPAVRPTTPLPQELPLDAILPNPHQPRKQFDDASIQSLAASIKSTGLIQPIVVRQAPDLPGQYELVAGERRLRAAKAAGLASIPALIREIDSFKQAQMALIENVQREDLNPIDRAEAYHTLIEKLGLTQAELASRIGEDRSSIANYLRLLELAPAVADMVKDGRLSLGHAKILAGIADPTHQQELADRIVGQGLSVRNLERILQEPPAANATRQAAPEPSAHIRDLERSLASQLGCRVQVRSGSAKGKGRLIIHYADLDQFDQVLERLGVKPE